MKKIALFSVVGAAVAYVFRDYAERAGRAVGARTFGTMPR
jgi:hypothetical protein